MTYIQSKLNGYVIDIREANCSGGTLVQTYPQKPAADPTVGNQLWNLESAADSFGGQYVWIKSQLCGLILDSTVPPGPGTSTALGTNVVISTQQQLTTSGQGVSQLWIFEPSGQGDGYSYIQNASSNFPPILVMSVGGWGNTEMGAPIVIDTAVNYEAHQVPSAAQLWRLI